MFTTTVTIKAYNISHALQFSKDLTERVNLRKDKAL